MTKPELPPICLIFSINQTIEKLKIALQSGIKWIQYREKELSRREILKQAFYLRELTNEYNALLTINDYLDIAIAVEADGVHLGQDDLPIEVAKRFFSGIIGISTHNLKEAVNAQESGADYIGFGPIFKTTTKKDALDPRGIDMLFFIQKKIDLPVVAIGGINLSNIFDIKKKGGKFVAVSSGILEGDVEKNVIKFIKILC